MRLGTRCRVCKRKQPTTKQISDGTHHYYPLTGYVKHEGRDKLACEKCCDRAYQAMLAEFKRGSLVK